MEAEMVEGAAAQPVYKEQLRGSLLRAEPLSVEEQYRRDRRLRYAGLACGVAAALVATAGLIGRFSGHFELARWVSYSRAMLPAAGLAFLLLGTGIVCICLAPHALRWAVRMFSIIAAGLMAARVAEELLGRDWDVSGLFLSGRLPDLVGERSFPEVGAIAVGITALGLILFTSRRTRKLAVGVGIGAVAAGGMLLLTFLLDRPLPARSTASLIAIPAAAALTAVGAGLMLAGLAWQRAVERLLDDRIAANQDELARLSREAARRRHELDIIIDAAPNGIVSFDASGNITRINQVARDMLDQTKLASLVRDAGGALEHILDEQGQPVALQDTAIYRALHGETVRGMVVNLRSLALGSIWVSASAAPIYDEKGRVDGAILVMADITALRDARNDAQGYAGELHAIMEYVPAGIIVYDNAGNIRRLNPAARDALGMSDDLAQRPADERFRIHDVVDEQGQEIAPDRGVVAAVLGGQTVRNVLANFRNTPRGSVWLSVSGAPIMRGGVMDGVIAAFTDVTRLHDLQVEAQRLADELQAILTSIPDGVAVYDPQGHVLRANPAADRLLQYTPEMRAMTWRERMDFVVPVGEDGAPLAPQDYPLKRALDGQSIVGFTMRFRRGEEYTPWLSVSAAPIRYGDQVVAAVVVLSDVSRMRQIEEELRSYHDHLEWLVRERTSALQANQAKLRALTVDVIMAEQHERQRLAGVIHDEVAQSLGLIKLRLNMLRAKPTPETIAETTAELMGLLDEAIKQSRAIMVELSPPILQQAGLIQALRWWADEVQRRHGLRVEVASEGEECRLHMDIEVAIFQTAKELLQNAVKHSQASLVQVDIACHRTGLVLQVKDNGVGFDEVSLAAKPDGGFGLFAIRERIAYLGGEFDIDSEPGKGTSIRLMIPLEEGAVPKSSPPVSSTIPEDIPY